eukprot:g5671.t1
MDERSSIDGTLKNEANLTSDMSLVKVRTITRFIVLSRDQSTWKSSLTAASTLCQNLASSYEKLGYTVQSLRIVTNPFGEYFDTSSEKSVLADLKVLKTMIQEVSSKIRVRVAVGACSSAAELKLVPAMIAHYGDLANVCINIPADEEGVVDAELCEAAAICIERLSKETVNGQGNFNFTANFACKPLIPYFPAGYNTKMSGESLAIGLENPDLLYSVLKSFNLSNVSPKDRSKIWKIASKAVVSAIQSYVDPLVDLARGEAEKMNVRFAGLDSSAAPSKDAISMCKVIESLGVPYFGASGTVEACAFLTRIFKSIKGVDLVGFSGLMLTCLEDKGMADAAAKGHYDIQSLLQYSCVCGIGLDCVPIPGDTPKEKIVGLMKDCGTLAYRYNKPLTVRLFPCIGLKAGDMTNFNSQDLCNCTIFAVR